MTTLTEREATDATRHRDAQSANAHEIRFTDVAPWAESLAKDLRRGELDDNVVWFAITVGAASIDQVSGRTVLGGDRLVRFFGSRYVEASYKARGAMHKLSKYCGVVLRDEAPANMAQQAQTRLHETATTLQEAISAVNATLSKHGDRLDVRTGGAMHLHTPLEPWQAHPYESIEATPETRCAICQEPLHYSNNAWRGKDGRNEVTKVVGSHHNGLPKHRRDHVHQPEGGAL